jgi:hypothetical protein
LGVTRAYPLTNPRSLASQLTQVVELGPSNAAAFGDIDVVDDRRMQRKDTLHTHAE